MGRGNGNGNRNGKTGMETEDRDGQHQTDVLDRDGQHQTDVSDRDGRRWASIAETEDTEETEKPVTRLIFRIEYKRLHEEEKKTKQGRQPSLYTQFSQLPYVLLLIPAQLTYVFILIFVLLTAQLIQPSLIQLGPRTDTLSKIKTSRVR